MSGSDFDRRVCELARKHRLPQEAALLMVNELLRQIAATAAIVTSVRTPIGTFRTATTKPRSIRNPVTGEQMALPRTYRLAFRAAKSQRRTKCG